MRLQILAIENIITNYHVRIIMYDLILEVECHFVHANGLVRMVLYEYWFLVQMVLECELVLYEYGSYEYFLYEYGSL